MKPRRAVIQESLERRILHGIACEWQNALWILPATLRQRMRRPRFRLGDSKRLLGTWSGRRREIVLSRRLVMDCSWDCVVEVLIHEMAHQLAEEVLGSQGGRPHGAVFQEACRLLRANPTASGHYPPLHDRIRTGGATPESRVLDRVKKLMALAESANRFEAEAAMAKAHTLIARYNIDILERNVQREFVSLFVGRPALRHFREAYHMADLLQEFYFVTGLWIPAYVVDNGRMGRVFEISGTARNVETAGYVHDFVERYILAGWREYAPEGTLGRHRRSDFAVGVIEGFREKLARQRCQRHARPSERHAVTILEDTDLQAYMAYRYPHTRSFRRQAARQNASIYAAGKQVGAELIISRAITEQSKGPRLQLD
jgi:hypothetical protein